MYRITHCLSVGPFATPERANVLLAAGVTHILNVSDTGCEVTTGPGSFAGVYWFPMSDRQRLPLETTIQALDTLHSLVSVPKSHVYIHCIAGMVRSPTILWLYLIACGLSPEYAQEIIEERSPDAVAGHPALVTDDHILLAQKHVLTHYFPLPRGEVILPFPTGNDE